MDHFPLVWSSFRQANSWEYLCLFFSYHLSIRLCKVIYYGISDYKISRYSQSFFYLFPRIYLRKDLSLSVMIRYAQRWAVYNELVYNTVYSIYICILYILQYFKKYMYIVSNIHFPEYMVYFTKLKIYNIFRLCSFS